MFKDSAKRISEKAAHLKKKVRQLRWAEKNNKNRKYSGKYVQELKYS